MSARKKIRLPVVVEDVDAFVVSKFAEASGLRVAVVRQMVATLKENGRVYVSCVNGLPVSVGFRFGTTREPVARSVELRSR